MSITPTNLFLRIFLALFCGLLFAAKVRAEALLRQTLNFNREWKFILGDQTGAEAPAYDDSHWNPVGLPHSFSTPYFLSAEFYSGYGWYRKRFDLPEGWPGKRVSLEFEGAFQHAEVFVNGHDVGHHDGGYTGFSLDITSALQPVGNVVAVRVNNLWNPRLAPRAGEHVFSGGLYRDVSLVVTDPLHVAWCGTFVTTPQVSRDFATVNVKTEIANASGGAKTPTVRTEVFDPEGKLITQVKTTAGGPMGREFTFDQTTSAIAGPRLWHPDHPFLYRVVTTVLDAGKAVDRFETPFGFRWFKWTADQGFFLNGEHFYFHGANVHQDHAGWGDAVTNAGFERDVKLVKDAGFDFIRGSHYPHDPAFADACDKYGLLFWSENCFWGTGSHERPWNASAYPPEAEDRPGFEESVRASLRDMIRIHRNHPSIVVWSMDNEVFFTEKSTLPRVREFLKELVALSHELDPTRPAAIGGCQRGEIDRCGDVAGYNGDGARLFPNPGIPNAVSEYGSTIADRPGRYEPGFGEVAGPPPAWRGGQVLWCAFDHGTTAGRFGRMGMLDYFRLPKRQWYWYRNEYRHIPPPAWPAPGTAAALKLTADKTTLRSVDGTDDTQLVVGVVDGAGTALSNSPQVTLTVESGPGEFPTGPAITFAPDSDIAIRDGLAAIEFRSYDAGESVIRATSPGLADAVLTIRSEGLPRYVAGQTPPVRARPYVRFTGGGTKGSANPGGPAVFGRDNPTLASSEAPGHTARLANDGNPATYWQPDGAEAGGWWQVDLERIVSIAQCRLTFPSAGDWRYKIEASEEGSTWKPAADERGLANTNTNDGAVRVSVFAAPVRGRYVRVTFPADSGGKPAALSEVEVSGSLSP